MCRNVQYLYQNSQYILKLTNLLAIQLFVIICNYMRKSSKWPNIERLIGLADISVSVTICSLTAKPNCKQNEIKMWKPHMHDIRAEFVFNLETFYNNCSMKMTILIQFLDFTLIIYPVHFVVEIIYYGHYLM